MGIIINESVESIIDENDSVERNKKQEEYTDYIKNHVLNVQKAFLKYFVPLLERTNISTLISDEELKKAVENVSVTIQEHDASKWSDDEFDGYREKYYPTVKEKADPNFQKLTDEKFDKAWESHYKHNWHHPKYWINEDGSIKDMNLEAIIEMICDWRSFSIAKDDPNEVLDWYNNEAFDEKKCITDKTKEIVEELLFRVCS